MIIPHFLSAGDKVAIVAPAKKVDRKNLLHGIEILSKWGLEVELGQHVFSGNHFLAGHDNERKEDLQQFISNPEIKAIFCARGGYGTSRIVDSLDFDPLLKYPKWIVGFSDITLLHLQLSHLGIASIHGPMPAVFHVSSPASISLLHEFLFGKQDGLIEAPGNPANRPGIAEGLATGGNLSMIITSLGTSLEIETTGKILILEEVDEPLYKIDRMMHQLAKANKLSGLAALIIGQFSKSGRADEDFDFTLSEIVSQLTVSYKYPIAHNFPFGHEKENLAIPLSYPIKVEISPEKSAMYFRS